MIVDAIVLAVLFVSALIAFLRGFIRETLTIIGVVGGLAAAYYVAPMIIPQIGDIMGVKEGEEAERLFGILPYTLLADILGYGLIFIAVVVVLSLVSHALAEAASSVGLGAIDRTLGVFFGLARGVLLLGLLFLPVYVFVDEETREPYMEGSQTKIYLEQTAAVLVSFFPEETVEKLEEDMDQASQKADLPEQLKKLRLGEQGEEAPQDQDDLENSSGYTEDFRQEMDRLFMQEEENPEESKR